MISDNLIQVTALALKDDWELNLPDTLSEEAILRLLADRIATILEGGPEVFFQLMYRLDISEKKLNAVLNDYDVPAKVAGLVYDRQLEKVKSRHDNRMQRDGDDPELKW